MQVLSLLEGFPTRVIQTREPKGHVSITCTWSRQLQAEWLPEVLLDLQSVEELGMLKFLNLLQTLKSQISHKSFGFVALSWKTSDLETLGSLPTQQQSDEKE